MTATRATDPSTDGVSAGSQWSVRLAPTQLRGDEVHVWKMRLTEWSARRAELAPLLDPRESERLSRFRFDRDQEQYVVAHALSRWLLSRYLGVSPEHVEFSLGPHGKPRLAEPGLAAFSFNLSHSGDMVVFAVARFAVGVDVERWSTEVECADLIGRFFSPSERREFLALGSGQQTASFFACWARKEAYIKATGDGVSRGLDYFDVTVSAAEPGRLLADRTAPDGGRGWTMLDVDVGRGYSGALVAAAAPCVPRFFVLDPRAPLRSP